ncbi:MAG: hypothetical protein F6K17_28070, partial [Okeania sp. SIO3C4]|nr:hypothetical protein [Okeania sp. SIO3C4]
MYRFFSITFLLIFPLFSWTDGNTTTRPKPFGIKLTDSHYKDLFNGDVKVYELKSDNYRYGHSVWMYRKSKRVKAKYFAHKDLQSGKSVYSKYEDWKQGKNLIMTCSGAFTTDAYGRSKPLGLTIDNGKMVNERIDEDMDGMVIVYATGGVVVSDIDEGNLYLASLKRKIDPRDPFDKAELVSWAKDEAATIFQTQLLVYRNELRVEVEKARTESAERRLLVLAQGREGVMHIVFNITQGVYLGDISKAIHEHLKDKGLNVIAMLNLDTGMYNIMDLYDKNGNSIDR